MLKEELLKMLANVPDGVDIDIQPPVEPPAEPPVETPAESPKIPNDQMLSITAADFMRMVEAYSQKHSAQPEAKKEKTYAEVFLH